jgi:anti-sigma B factor antagonist
MEVCAVEATITYAVRKLGDRVRAIDVRGDVNSSTESALGDAFAVASSGDVAGVVLNFAGLEYMNSGGIGVLVTLLIRAKRRRQRLVAVGLSDHYRHIFELTRLDEAIQVFATDDAARHALES